MAKVTHSICMQVATTLVAFATNFFILYLLPEISNVNIIQLGTFVSFTNQIPNVVWNEPMKEA